ncbi:MAG: hypothetical protein DRH24_13560 [Deltaproteobacteria bacterium]|nr:MAG: hypothetical protein DRH24_13560 [Deltaproteobacteria bacterium]
MDVNLFIPINPRVNNILADGYSITWELSAAATAQLTDEGTNPVINIYGRDAITTLVSILGVVSADSTTFAFMVNSGISEVYMTAELNGTETAASPSILLVSTNIMPEASLTSVARDEDGVPRSIAVTSDGAVKVTGVSVTNYGGDASAANQTSALAKADALLASSNSVKDAVDLNTAALSGVGLNAATILALQVSAINNFPTDYPDTNTVGAINNLASVTAKDTTVATIAANTNNALKRTDLQLTAGVLDVRETAMPTNFPDAAVLSELLTHKGLLTSIDAHMLTNNAELVVGNTISTANRDFNEVSAVTLDTIESHIAGMAPESTAIVVNTGNTAASIGVSNTKLDALISSNATLVKTTDLALTAGVLSVAESNPITDFPDSTAHTLLSTLNTSILALDAPHAITFGESLPAGTNALGSVVVTNTVLPANAATESSLSAAVTMLNTGNVNTSSLRLIATNISTKLDALLASSTNNDQVVICDELLNVTTSTDFRPESIIAPSLLTSFSKYTLQIFSYANPGSVGIYKESAINNNLYYHVLPEYRNMSLFSDTVLERDFTLVRNIMVRIIGSGQFRVRITGIN